MPRCMSKDKAFIFRAQTTGLFGFSLRATYLQLVLSTLATAGSHQNNFKRHEQLKLP